MLYWIGQGLGLIVTVLCILGAQLKKPWQMLVNSAAANFIGAISFFCLNGVSSAVMMNGVAVAQTLINAHHAYHKKPSPLSEKLVFLALYVFCGCVKIHTPIDILPLAGALLFMCGNFQRNAQVMRMFSVFNCLVWIVYDAIIGTTAVISQILSLISVLIALFRYRKTEIQKETVANAKTR